MIAKLSKLEEVDKIGIDVFSIVTLGASITGMITPLAALLTLVWSGIRIYETDTVQKVLKKK